MARKLIYVRIVHSQADLGTAAQSLGAIGKDRLSAEGWRKHQQRVAAFWGRLRVEVMERVEKELPGTGWEKLRIYQDGMPAGAEIARRIVEEVAEKGSLNYQMLRELLKRGARLEKTEHAGLLREEYRLIRQIVAAASPAEREQAQQSYRRRSEALLGQRDRFIAKRIDQTLKEGEVGVLFIGASHRVIPYLPGDIEIISLS